MTYLRKVVVAASAIVLLAGSAFGLEQGNNLAWSGWTWPPLIMIPLILAVTLYGVGILKRLQIPGNTQRSMRSAVYFLLAIGSLIIALDSPIHEISEQLFWVHMTQHEILMLVSAPLLVLSRPLVPFLRALPRTLREHVANLGRWRPFKAAWTGLSAPLSAWLLSATALWAWHLPWLFDQTLSNDWVHAAQHITFLSTAMLFWWPVLEPRRLNYGTALVYVFTTALQTSVLGAMLTFAPRPCYVAYLTTAPQWHLSPLEDQQLGGLIMWIPAGTLLTAIGLALLIKWVAESQRRWEYSQTAAFLASVTRSSP